MMLHKCSCSIGFSKENDCPRQTDQVSGIGDSEGKESILVYLSTGRKGSMVELWGCQSDLTPFELLSVRLFMVTMHSEAIWGL